MCFLRFDEGKNIEIRLQNDPNYIISDVSEPLALVVLISDFEKKSIYLKILIISTAIPGDCEGFYFNK